MTLDCRIASRPVSRAWLLPLSCLLLGWLSPPVAAADRLVTSEGPLLGEVVGMTPEAVEFREQGSKGRSRRIPVDAIVTLSLQSEPSRVTEARQLLEQGEFEAAAAVLAEVTPVELEVASAAVRGEHAYVTAAIAGRQAVATGKDLAGGLAAVTDFLDRFSRSIHRFELIELAGDLELAAGRPEAAIASYRQLAQGPPSLAIRAARREGETLLALGKTAEAAAVLSAAAESPASDENSRRERAAASIGEASCLIRLDRPAEAVTQIRRLLATMEPPAAADKEGQQQLGRAYATLGRALLANHQEQDGLIAYLTVDLVHSSDPDSHAEALYRLQELWDQGRYPQRASEARRRLEAEYPESAWAARLRRPVH